MVLCNRSAAMSLFSGRFAGDTGSFDGCGGLAGAEYCVAAGSPAVLPRPVVGLCLPTDCGRGAIIEFLANANLSGPSLGLPFASSVAAGDVSVLCGDGQAAVSDSYERLAIVMLVVVVIVLVIVVGATLYDLIAGITRTVERHKAMVVEERVRVATESRTRRAVTMSEISRTHVSAHSTGLGGGGHYGQYPPQRIDSSPLYFPTKEAFDDLQRRSSLRDLESPLIDHGPTNHGVGSSLHPVGAIGPSASASELGSSGDRSTTEGQQQTCGHVQTSHLSGLGTVGGDYSDYNTASDYGPPEGQDREPEQHSSGREDSAPGAALQTPNGGGANGRRSGDQQRSSGVRDFFEKHLPQRRRGQRSRKTKNPSAGGAQSNADGSRASPGKGLFSTTISFDPESTGDTVPRAEKLRTEVQLQVEQLIEDLPDLTHIPPRIARTFSLLASVRRWRTASSNDSPLRIFNSIRTICWLWIVMADTFRFSSLVPTYNAVFSTRTNPIYAFANPKASSTFAIGTFLLLSGFVTVLQLYQEDVASRDPVKVAMRQHRRWARQVLDAVQWYVLRLLRRWFRLMPIYVAVVFLSQTLLLGKITGPFWSSFTNSEALHGNCLGGFFSSNVFFINNVSPSDVGKRCFPWTYYFALEFQFFAVAPLVHYSRRFIPGQAVGALLALFGGASVYLRFLSQPECSVQFTARDSIVPLGNTDFETPWTMVIPYCLGGALSLFYMRTLRKAQELKMFGAQAMHMLSYSLENARTTSDRVSYWLLKQLNRKRARVLCIWSGIVITSGTVLVSWLTTREDVLNCHYTARVFAAVSILPWCTGIFLSFLPLVFGYGGAIQRFLAHRLWNHPSKLIFTAYLVHPLIISLNNASASHPDDFNAFQYLYDAWGNATMSAILGLVFHLSVEQPFMYLTMDTE